MQTEQAHLSRSPHSPGSACWRNELPSCPGCRADPASGFRRAPVGALRDLQAAWLGLRPPGKRAAVNCESAVPTLKRCVGRRQSGGIGP